MAGSATEPGSTVNRPGVCLFRHYVSGGIRLTGKHGRRGVTHEALFCFLRCCEMRSKKRQYRKDHNGRRTIVMRQHARMDQSARTCRHADSSTSVSPNSSSYQRAWCLFTSSFDIFPVSETSIGDELAMDREEVERWSIYANGDAGGQKVLFAVGADETGDFIRQSYIAAQMLGTGRDDNIVLVDGANHMTVLTRLATDDTLFDAVAGDLMQVS